MTLIHYKKQAFGKTFLVQDFTTTYTVECSYDFMGDVEETRVLEENEEIVPNDILMSNLLGTIEKEGLNWTRIEENGS